MEGSQRPLCPKHRKGRRGGSRALGKCLPHGKGEVLACRCPRGLGGPLGVHRPEPHCRGLDAALKVHTGVHEPVPPSRGDPKGAEATPLGRGARRGSGRFGSHEEPAEPAAARPRLGGERPGPGLRWPVPGCADGRDQPPGAPGTANTLSPRLRWTEAGDMVTLVTLTDSVMTRNLCRRHVSMARDKCPTLCAP